MIKFTTQFTFDPSLSDKHVHSDELITIPDDSFTIQELMQRAVANTLPPLANHYEDEYFDEEISFEDDLQFFQPSDFQELYDMRDSLDKRISQLSTQLEHEKIEENLAPPKETSLDNNDVNQVD